MLKGSAFRGHTPTVLTLLIGIVASVVTYTAVREYSGAETDGEFAAQASNHANTIVKGFSQAVFAIESVGALYDSTENVSQDQFASFVTHLLERFSTITALGWAPQVLHSERGTVEEAARLAGVTPSALKVRAHRGYQALRKRLGKNGRDRSED